MLIFTISVFCLLDGSGCQLGTLLAPFWVPSWSMLGTKLASNGLKWRFKKCFKKRSPATFKQRIIYMPGGPWGAPPIIKTFWERNSCSSNSWSTVRNSCRKSELDSKSLQQKLNGLLNIVDICCKNWNRYSNTCSNTRSMIWHALGKGLANFYASRWLYYYTVISYCNIIILVYY